MLLKGSIYEDSGLLHVVFVQSLSCVWLFATPWPAAQHPPLSFAIFQSLLKFMSIESVIPSNDLILCCPLLLLSPIFPSIRVFSNELALHIRWPEYWSFSFSISPPMNIQGLFPLGMSGWISLPSKGLSRVFSSTAIQKHQFFGTQSPLLSNSHIHTWLWKNHSFDSMDFCQAKWYLYFLIHCLGLS